MFDTMVSEIVTGQYARQFHGVVLPAVERRAVLGRAVEQLRQAREGARRESGWNRRIGERLATLATRVRRPAVAG